MGADRENPKAPTANRRSCGWREALANRRSPPHSPWEPQGEFYSPKQGKRYKTLTGGQFRPKKNHVFCEIFDLRLVPGPKEHRMYPKNVPAPPQGGGQTPAANRRSRKTTSGGAKKAFISIGVLPLPHPANQNTTPMGISTGRASAPLVVIWQDLLADSHQKHH